MARDQRQRNAYSPDEVRSRLHDRAEDALVRDPEEPEPSPGAGSEPVG